MRVVTGTTPYGQGHRTAWAMLVAERLGVELSTSTTVTSLATGPAGIVATLDAGGDALAMVALYDDDRLEVRVLRGGARPIYGIFALKRTPS